MRSFSCFRVEGSLLRTAGRGLPGGNSLSFASPKESKQRKGDPAVCVPFALLRGNLRCSVQAGSRSNSLRCTSLRQSRSLIRLNLRSSAHTEGAIENGSGNQIPTRTRHGESLFLQVFGVLSSAVGSSAVRYWYSFLHPLWMRRGAEDQTDQGKNLFERSELFLTPAGPSTAGCPQRSAGTQEPGSPFFCLLFFGEAKKSELPPGNPRPASLRKERAARARTGHSKVRGGTTP